MLYNYFMGVCKSSKHVTSNLKSGSTAGSIETKKYKSDSDLTLHNSKQSPTNKNGIVVNSELIVEKSSGSPLEKYKILQRLGEGSYGVVWKVKHIETGLDRAMKKISKNKKAQKSTESEILDEISILKKIDHPSIVKIFEFFNSKDGYYLITEYCHGGELFDVIKQKTCLTEPVAANIMFQLFSAVNYCHKSLNIIHRDLKPENILIESYDQANGFYNIKIIDFGTAKIFEKNKTESKVIGSSYYIAPEVLGKNYNEKCDIWSCGVIMYILLSGRAPFSGNKDSEIIAKIKTGSYDLSKRPFDKISSEAKDLIQKLLQMNPSNRISAEKALNHKWFKLHNTRKSFCEDTQANLRRIIENLSKYNPTSKLQQVVLAYLVHNLTAIEEIKIINKVFSLFNTSSDGKLTKDQTRKGLSEYLFTKEKNKKLIEEKVDEIFRNIDNDNNGYIEFEEFARAGLDKSIFTAPEVLQFAFRFLDKDHSEEITLEEVKEVFCVGEDSEAAEEQLREIIKSIDTDGNGNISYKEFEAMMQEILK